MWCNTFVLYSFTYILAFHTDKDIIDIRLLNNCLLCDICIQDNAAELFMETHCLIDIVIGRYSFAIYSLNSNRRGTLIISAEFKSPCWRISGEVSATAEYGCSDPHVRCFPANILNGVSSSANGFTTFC